MGCVGLLLAWLPSLPSPAVAWMCFTQAQVSCLAESQRKNLTSGSLTLKTLKMGGDCWRYPLLIYWSWLGPAGTSLQRSGWAQPRAAGAWRGRRFSSFSFSWGIYLCRLCFPSCSLFMVFPLSPQARRDHDAGTFRRGPKAVDGSHGWPGTGEQKH